MESAPLLSYVEMGQGLPLVLLHGFCESKDFWAEFAPPLADRYRVIVVDLPGFGANPPLEHPLTIGDMADAVYSLLQHLKIEHSVMVGHSLGGYVTMAFAEKFPHRLKGLGLFHSTSASDSYERKQARNKTIEFIERYGVEEFVSDFMPSLFFEGRRKDLKDWVARVTEQGKLSPKSTVIETIKAMRDRKDRSKVLERATCPVLFIFGKNDGIIPVANGLNLAALPSDTTVHVLSSCGHMGMLEYANETRLMVRHFLEYVEKTQF